MKDHSASLNADWQPTMQLRYVEAKSGPYRSGRLQQFWIERFSGVSEWREVPCVEDERAQ